jgi:hypothetical protein
LRQADPRPRRSTDSVKDQVVEKWPKGCRAKFHGEERIFMLISGLSSVLSIMFLIIFIIIMALQPFVGPWPLFPVS